MRGDLQKESKFYCIDHRAFLPGSQADPQGFHNGGLTRCYMSLPLGLLVKSHWPSINCGSEFPGWPAEKEIADGRTFRPFSASAFAEEKAWLIGNSNKMLCAS